jgi:transposase-like protein
MTRQRRAGEMYAVIETYLATSQSELSFCEEHGITRSVFAYWRTKYRKQAPPSGFVQVVPAATPAEKAHVEILYPGGTRVRLFSAVTPAYVRGLVTDR